MSIFNTWWFNLVAYLFLCVTFTQCYKKATKSIINDGAFTVLFQILSGIILIFFIPFFKMHFPSNIKTYLLLVLSCVFYAIVDRSNTTARRGLDVSFFSILEQLSKVFVITWGIIFLKEKLFLKQFIGVFLILSANVMVLYRKGKIQWNKYVLVSILGNLAMSIASFIDVGISEQFNLPIYVLITLFVPAIFIFIIEKIKVKDLILEYQNGDKKAIFFLCLSAGIMVMTLLRAYQYGSILIVTPLSAITTLLNVFFAYFIFKEKGSLFKKILAAVIVIIGVILFKI